MVPCQKTIAIPSWSKNDHRYGLHVKVATFKEEMLKRVLMPNQRTFIDGQRQDAVAPPPELRLVLARPSLLTIRRVDIL